MIDPFMLLAPVLLLAVVALLRFVGCDVVFRIDPVPTSTPTVTDFDPQDATAGDPDFPLTVIGSGFVDGLKVQLDNDAPFTPPAGSVTASAITFQMPAAKVANAGQVNVTVTNPDGATSSLPYTIQELVKVTFPGPGPNDQPATGNSLNFDAMVWSWEPGTLDDSVPHIFSHQSGLFTFVTGPKLLKSMIVSANYNGGVVTVDNGMEPTQQMVPIPSRTMGTPGTPKRLEELGSIKFTKKTMTVTVSFSVTDSLVIDTIFYQGPR